MNLSFLIDNNKTLKDIYNQFYKDINKLNSEWSDEDIELIKPENIDISTGV